MCILGNRSKQPISVLSSIFSLEPHDILTETTGIYSINTNLC